jgi:hypothetical protein
MKSLPLILTALCLGVGAIQVQQDVARAHAYVPLCRAGKVVTANREFRVVTVSGNHQKSFFGCPRGSLRARRLGERYDELDSEFTGHFRLNGRYLAYEHSMYGRENSIYTVRVWNARTNRQRSYQTGLLTPEQRRTYAKTGDAGVGPVTDMALSSTGHVAWIARNLPWRRYEVWAQRGRLPDLLDADVAIVPDSLRLSGKVLMWRHEGALRDVRFP